MSPFAPALRNSNVLCPGNHQDPASHFNTAAGVRQIQSAKHFEIGDKAWSSIAATKKIYPSRRAGTDSRRLFAAKRHKSTKKQETES